MDHNRAQMPSSMKKAPKPKRFSQILRTLINLGQLCLPFHEVAKASAGAAWSPSNTITPTKKRKRKTGEEENKSKSCIGLLERQFVHAATIDSVARLSFS